jgi:serine protease Do
MLDRISWGIGALAVAPLALLAAAGPQEASESARRAAERAAAAAEDARERGEDAAELADAYEDWAGEVARIAETANEKVRRAVRVAGVAHGGRLGVRLADVAAEDRERLRLETTRGALVQSVEPDSPAAQAGLREDDVIVRFDGEAVRSVAQLVRLVRETPPGRPVSLEVSRAGEKRTLQATLAERGPHALVELGELPELDLPEPPEPLVAPRFEWHGNAPLVFRHRGPLGPRKLGLGYRPIEGQLAEYFKVPGGKGLLVESVEPDGPADKAGVRAGDVLLQAGGRTLDDASDFRDVVREAEPGKPLALEVLRDGKRLELTVTPAGERNRGLEQGGRAL